jgi:hypothetical protein
MKVDWQISGKMFRSSGGWTGMAGKSHSRNRKIAHFVPVEISNCSMRVWPAWG